MMWQNEFRSSSHDTKSSFSQFSLSPCFLCFCIEWPRVPTTVFCQIILSVSCDLRGKKRKKERKNLRRDGIKERLFPLYFILYIYIKILSFFSIKSCSKETNLERRAGRETTTTKICSPSSVVARVLIVPSLSDNTSETRGSIGSNDDDDDDDALPHVTSSWYEYMPDKRRGLRRPYAAVSTQRVFKLDCLLIKEIISLYILYIYSSLSLLFLFNKNYKTQVAGKIVNIILIF